MFKWAENTIDKLLIWAGDAGIRRSLVLVGLCLALMLPGFFTLPPSDRDESRFAQATKQMLESGDYIDIRFQDTPRHKKPAGIYWLQAVGAQAMGGPEHAPIWAYRLPSLFGAILAAMLTAWAALPLIGARASLLAGILLASTVLIGVEARMAKTDAALLAATVFSMGCLIRLWHQNTGRYWHILGFWGGIGIGLLLKGPLILLPIFGSLGAICWQERSLGCFRKINVLAGILIVALMVLPWGIAIVLKTDGAFFREAIGRDLIGKITSGQESHGAPPGYYLLALWGTFWPWGILALFSVPLVWAHRKKPEIMFLLGWIVPAWLVFEGVSTKLPHYVLPLYPAITALIAYALVQGDQRTPQRWLLWTGVILWTLPALFLPLAAISLPFVVEGSLGVGTVVFAFLALWMHGSAIKTLFDQRIMGFIALALAGAACTYMAVFQYALPSLNQVWISPRMVAAAAPYRACSTASLGSAVYHEPSLVFLAGTNTRLIGPEQAAQALATEPGALMFVEHRVYEQFAAALDKHGMTAMILAEINGFNYNGGDVLSLGLYARAGDEMLAPCIREVAQ